MGFLLLAAVSFLSGSGCKLFRARALSFSVPQSHVSTRSHPQCRRGRKRVLLTPPACFTREKKPPQLGSYTPSQRNHLPSKEVLPFHRLFGMAARICFKAREVAVRPATRSKWHNSWLASHWTGNKFGCYWLEKVDVSLRIEGFTHDSQPGPRLWKA